MPQLPSATPFPAGSLPATEGDVLGYCSLLLYHAFQSAPDATLSMSVSGEDLAALLGATKETASRLLSEFREEGVVATQRSRITVLDPERLRRLAWLYD